MRWIKNSCLALVSLGLLLSGCSSKQLEVSPQQTEKQSSNDVSSLNWKVPAFKATNQDGQSLGSEELKGKVWLADFIFTRCPNICPPMTANMVRVQKELNNQNINAHIISFSVDPEYDKPDILENFATKHAVDLKNWSFLTGYKLPELQQIIQTAFKGTITQQPSPSEEMPMLINHPSQFYLIDQQGKVRKFYDGLKPNPKQIAEDIKQLTR